MTDAAEILAAADRLLADCENAKQADSGYVYEADAMADILLVASYARRAAEALEQIGAWHHTRHPKYRQYSGHWITCHMLTCRVTQNAVSAVLDPTATHDQPSERAKWARGEPAPRFRHLMEPTARGLFGDEDATHDHPRDGAQEDEEWGPDSAQQRLERGP